MVEKKLNIGIIGCGRVSDHYLKIFNSKKIKKFNIVAACDKNIKKTYKFKKKFNCDVFSKIDNMLESIEADLIILLTPSGLHYKHAAIILKKKFNLLLEKPPALMPKQILELSKIAKRNKLFVTVAYQNRLNPAMTALKEAVNKKRFGKIITSTIRLRWCRYNDYYNDEWHGTWEMDGGVLNQQAIHHLDGLNWLVGPFVKVSSISTKRLNNLEAEDTIVGILENTNGSLSTIEATTAARPNDIEASISIIGEKGYAEIGGIALNEIKKWDFIKKIEKDVSIKKNYSQKVPSGYGLSHITIINNIIEKFLENKSIKFTTLDETISTCNLVHAMYKSNEQKRWIKVSNNNLSKKLGRNNG